MLPPNGFLKNNYCPYCNYNSTAAMRLENGADKPEPGALSICAKCAKIAIFKDDMSLDRFDMNTVDLEDHAYLIKMQYMAHGVNGRYAKENKKH